MSQRSTFDADPRRLAPLMDLKPEAAKLWEEKEFASVLRHQLSAPFEPDLLDFMKDPVDRRTVTGAEPNSFKTYADLLMHPNPSVDLLEAMKDFAKACRTGSKSALPKEVATVLYYASLAAALVRCGKRITTLTDRSLREGVDWACAQPWLEESLRGLFHECREHLGAQGGKTS